MLVRHLDKKSLLKSLEKFCVVSMILGIKLDQKLSSECLPNNKLGTIGSLKGLGTNSGRLLCKGTNISSAVCDLNVPKNFQIHTSM